MHGKAAVLEWADEDGSTLLHFACLVSDSSPESAKALLELGADPNRRNEFNETPLHHCALDGSAERREIARHLIDHGANRKKEDGEGETPLDYSQREGHTEMARLLEEYVASPPAAAQGPGQVRFPRPLCAATCATLPVVLSWLRVIRPRP